MEREGKESSNASRVFNFKVNICLQGAFDIYYLWQSTSGPWSVVHIGPKAICDHSLMAKL